MSMYSEQRDSIFLPIGFGLGTIIFDKNGDAWRAVKEVLSPIYEIHKITDMTKEEIMKSLIGKPYLKSEP